MIPDVRRAIVAIWAVLAASPVAGDPCRDAAGRLGGLAKELTGDPQACQTHHDCLTLRHFGECCGLISAPMSLALPDHKDRAAEWDRLATAATRNCTAADEGGECDCEQPELLIAVCVRRSCRLVEQTACMPGALRAPVGAAAAVYDDAVESCLKGVEPLAGPRNLLKNGRFEEALTSLKALEPVVSERNERLHRFLTARASLRTGRYKDAERYNNLVEETVWTPEGKRPAIGSLHLKAVYNNICAMALAGDHGAAARHHSQFLGTVADRRRQIVAAAVTWLSVRSMSEKVLPDGDIELVDGKATPALARAAAARVAGVGDEIARIKAKLETDPDLAAVRTLEWFRAGLVRLDELRRMPGEAEFLGRP